MKIIAAGDLHFLLKRPANRLDDYLVTQTDKLTFILDYAEGLRGKSLGKEGVVVAFPGDIFHSPEAPYLLFQHYAKILLTYPMIVKVAVWGQHDLRYRTSRENTPLYALAATGLIHLLGKIPLMIDDADFYGVSVGEPIPEILSKERYNVLVIHEMIIDDKLWPGQEDYKLASVLLRTTPYQLIISGDNHQSFARDLHGKILVNSGSLMRSAIDQRYHQPRFAMIDVGSRVFTWVDIPVRPITEVMDIEKSLAEAERDENIEAFVDGLSEDVEITLDFLADLFTFLSDNDVDKKTRKLLEECVDGAVRQLGADA